MRQNPAAMLDPMPAARERASGSGGPDRARPRPDPSLAPGSGCRGGLRVVHRALGLVGPLRPRHPGGRRPGHPPERRCERGRAAPAAATWAAIVELGPVGDQFFYPPLVHMIGAVPAAFGVDSLQDSATIALNLVFVPMLAGGRVLDRQAGLRANRRDAGGDLRPRDADRAQPLSRLRARRGAGGDGRRRGRRAARLRAVQPTTREHRRRSADRARAAGQARRAAVPRRARGGDADRWRLAPVAKPRSRGARRRWSSPGPTTWSTSATCSTSARRRRSEARSVPPGRRSTATRGSPTTT